MEPNFDLTVKTQAARSVGERCRMYARFPALSLCSSSLFCRADGRLHKYWSRACRRL